MKRTFLGWDGPALPRAVERLVDAYLDGGRADLSDALLVLPGARAGRRIKELLVEEAGRRGIRLSPPEVTTVGHLPERLFEAPGVIATSATVRMAWAHALRETPRDRLSTLYARIPAKSAIAEWVALGSGVATLHRDVARGGWDFAAVEARASSAAARGRLTWDDAARWRVLSGIQSRFRELLASAGRHDPDLARLDALAEGRVGTEGADRGGAPQDLWLIGLSDLPGVVRRFLIEVGPRVHALVVAPESAAASFDDFGGVRPAAWSTRAIDLPDEVVAVADRPGDQADRVLEALVELAPSRPIDDVVIGAPDAEVVPWLQERLSAAGIASRDAAGDELVHTAPYRLLAATGELVADLGWDAFASLVRHPDVERWIAGNVDVPDAPEGAPFVPGGWLGRLDAWYGEHLPAGVPRGWGSQGFQGRRGDHGEIVAAVFDGVARLLGPLADPEAERPLTAWMPEVLEYLTRTRGDEGIDTADPRGQKAARALGELGGAARRILDLPAEVDATCTASVAIGVLLREAAGGTVPATPDRRAVEILGWLELHLDDAPIAIVTGVNEGSVPESVEGDAFLPDALRSELELEDNRLRYARDAYLVTAMSHSKEALRLISGRRTVSGDPLRPSRVLLADSDRTRTARRILRLHGEGAGERASGERAPESETAPAAAAPSRFVLPPHPVLEFEPPASLSVTDFRAILADPYAWVLQRVRRAQPVEDEAREMDAAVFGDVAHAVLEAFGSEDPEVESDDPARVRAAIDARLDTEIERRFGPGARFARVAVRLQVEQLRARLRAFADRHAARVAEGWRIQGAELRTPPGGVPFEVDGIPIGIRARIDRVDHHPVRGEFAVFDYKTGDTAKRPDDTHRKGRGDGRGWVDLQLPLYRILLPHVLDRDGDPAFAGVDPSRVRLGYVLLPRDLHETRFELADWDDGLLDEALETAREVVRFVRGGRAEFDPTRLSRWTDEPTKAYLGLGQLVGVDAASGSDDEDDDGSDGSDGWSAGRDG